LQFSEEVAFDVGWVCVDFGVGEVIGLSELCPICGSKMVDMSNIPFPHVTCPQCSSHSVGFYFDADILEKCGSKLVVKHGVECVTLDCVCEDCGHTWSVYCSYKDGVFTAVGSKV